KLASLWLAGTSLCTSDKALDEFSAAEPQCELPKSFHILGWCEQTFFFVGNLVGRGERQPHVTADGFVVAKYNTWIGKLSPKFPSKAVATRGSVEDHRHFQPCGTAVRVTNHLKAVKDIYTH